MWLQYCRYALVKLLMDYSLSYGHHGLRPCSTHLGSRRGYCMQANGKPLVSSTHAQNTTKALLKPPDGPSRGRAEAMWGWRQNRSSKAGKVLYTRFHGECCFYMMMTSVPGALVAMGWPPVDLNISSRAPTGLPSRFSVRHRGPSELNLLLQAKVTGRF